MTFNTYLFNQVVFNGRLVTQVTATGPQIPLEAGLIEYVSLQGSGLDLPISGATVRLSLNNGSSMSASVPDPDHYRDLIDAIGDSFTLDLAQYVGQTLTTYTLFTGTLSSPVALSNSPSDSSIGLSFDNDTLTWVPVNRTIAGAIQLSNSGAGRTFDAPLDPEIRPGDRVAYGSNSFVPNRVDYSIAPNHIGMQLQEDIRDGLAVPSFG